jgi:hypothetical protein
LLVSASWRITWIACETIVARGTPPNSACSGRAASSARLGHPAAGRGEVAAVRLFQVGAAPEGLGVRDEPFDRFEQELLLRCIGKGRRRFCRLGTGGAERQRQERAEDENRPFETASKSAESLAPQRSESHLLLLPARPSQPRSWSVSRKRFQQ